MTITPETLRELARRAKSVGHILTDELLVVPALELGVFEDALRQAADELERLQNLSACELCDAYLKKMGEEQVEQWRKEGKLL